jgi:hypothetical protein
MMKISRPMTSLILAKTSQDLTLDVGTFPAADFLSKVTPPTPMQLQNQYDSFSDRLPENYGAPGDLLGFGYKYPNRVKLEYMGVRPDDVRAAAIASKSALDWNLAAVSEFKTNRERYDSEEVQVPSTQPSLLQATTQAIGAATIPATMPTMVSAVKKLDDFDADFALHANVVLKSLYEQETTKLTETIAKKISDVTTADFGAWRDAQAAGSPTTQPASSLGVPFNSKEYFVALAQSIQKQYGVLPTYGRVDRFENTKELTNIEGIGKAILPYGRAEIPFNIYATQLVQPLMDDKAKASQLASLGLALYQPSNVLIGDSDYYLFRVTETDPSHTAPYDEVRDQVATDYALGKAYALAVDAAHAALSDAGVHGLQSALNSAGHPVMITTDPFNPEQVKSDVRNAPATAKIPPLSLKPDSVFRLADGAEQLLTTGSDTQHPMSVIELYADATALVTQLDAATPSYAGDNANYDQAMMSARLADEEGNLLVGQLVQYDSAADRLNFKMKETDTAKN